MSFSLRRSRLCSQQRLDLCDFATHALEVMGLRLLTGTLLHAQVELFATQLDQLRVEFLRGLFAAIFQFHHSTVRFTNWVCTDSLAAARRKASRASTSVTPSISYNMRPGCTTATQNSTLPLPLPIRTSMGFLVIGLSGKTRIHSLPPRLTKRVTQRRAASIWRAVRWPCVVAFRPYSPKLTLLAT